MADIASGMINAFASGTALRKDREADQRRTSLNALAQQAYGAAPDQRDQFVQQAVGVDAASGFGLADKLETDEVRKGKALVNMSKMLTSVPEEYREAQYQRMRPSLERFGIPNLPLNYNAQVGEVASSIVASLGQSSASGVQSTYINAQGQRVAIMRDGSQQLLGDADRRTQLRDHPGMPPELVDLRAATTSPLTTGQPQGQPAPMGPPMPQGQMAPGEVPFTIDPSLPPEVQASIRANEQQWAQASDVNIPSRSGGSSPAAMRPAMTPAQMAADQRAEDANRRAEQAAQNAARGNAPAGFRFRPDASLEPIPGAPQSIAKPMSAAERRDFNSKRDKLPQLNASIRRVERIKQAVAELSDPSRMIQTGRLDQYVQGWTKEGQELDAAVGSLRPTLLALTRIPGIGVQSDLDVRLDALQFPSLDKPPETNAENIAELEIYMQDLAAAYRNVMEDYAEDQGGGQSQQAPQQGGDAPQSNAIQRARNPQTGEVVELRNGVWVPAR